jgi:hypothetical protein
MHHRGGWAYAVRAGSACRGLAQGLLRTVSPTRGRALASALSLALCCIASNAAADPTPSVYLEFGGCAVNQLVPLDAKFACAGLASGAGDFGHQPQIQNVRFNESLGRTEAYLFPNGQFVNSGSMVLNFSPAISQIDFEVYGTLLPVITAFAGNDPVDSVSPVNLGGFDAGHHELTGAGITRIEFSNAGHWFIADISFTLEDLVDGCAATCDGTSAPDTDSDGVHDPFDGDDDNDGVPDGSDPGPLDPTFCGLDADHDTCDDCTVGVDQFGSDPDNDPANDGADTDIDGICNVGDDRWLIESHEFTLDPDSDDECWWSGGGVRFDSGFDRDNDGLDESEIDVGSTVIVCNAYDGVNMITYSEGIEPGDEECPAGGVFLQYVVDIDGDREADEDDDIFTNTQVLCNAPHSLAISEPLEPDSEGCATGGFEVRIGLDLDSDGELTGDDDYSWYEVCNGADSLLVSEPIAPQSELCATGGFFVEVGADLNHDGELSSEDDEDSVGMAVCHGLNARMLSAPLEPDSELCPSGGMEFIFFTDVDDDGVPVLEEPHSEGYVCNGLDSVMNTTSVGPNPELCPSGGFRVRSGIDENADGFLDSEFEDFTTEYVCHGLNSLVRSTTLDPSPEGCPTGGVRIDVGLDDDGDGELEDDEVDSSETLCSGAHSLTRTTALDADPDGACPTGGTRIEVGSDLDGDGELAPSEVATTRQVCSVQSSVSRESEIEAGASTCPAGGSKVETGLDANGNAALDDGEVAATEYVCNDTHLALRHVRLASGSDECPGGGTLIEQGVDRNGDGELNDAEVQWSESLCDVFDSLFSTENLPEGDVTCVHGGMRVRTGRDDGVPSGSAGDGLLQLGEAEITRDVCLAGSDVLVNGASAECNLAPGKASSDSSRFATLCTLLVLAVAAGRRGSRFVRKDRSGGMHHGDEERCANDARWFGRSRAKAAALFLGAISLCAAGSVHAEEAVTIDYSSCDVEELTELADTFACDGLAGGEAFDGDPVLFMGLGASGEMYANDNAQQRGEMFLEFSPTVSSVTIDFAGNLHDVFAYDANDDPVDEEIEMSSGGIVTLTGSGIAYVELIGSTSSNWYIQALSFTPEGPVPGCAATCDGSPLVPVVDTDGDTIPDDSDTDDDNDGVLDGPDPSDLDPDVCGDFADGDSCDDCTTGTDGFGATSDVAPLTDGPDSDHDGICDAGDNRPLVITEELEGDGPCDEFGVAIITGVDRDGDGELDFEAEDEVENVVFLCDGADGLSTVADWEELEGGDEICPQGGVRLSLAFDEDFDFAFDSEFDEVYATQSLCNGMNSLIVTEPVDDNAELCPTDGVRVLLGTDTDNDGEFDDGDEPSEHVICNGLNSLIVSEPSEPNAEICPTGGYEVTLGTDLNGDGELSGSEELELANGFDICHGLNGLIVTTPLEPNAEICANGGVFVEFGTDANADDELDDGDDNYSSQVLCNGHNGLVETRVLEPDPETCPQGGFEVAVGTDFNGNGELDVVLEPSTPVLDPVVEISSTRRVCHGLNSLVRTTALSPDPLVCPMGGTKIEAGTDYNGNGELDAEPEQIGAPVQEPHIEITSSEVICHGLNTLTKTTALEPDAAVCPTGGTRIELGTDGDGNGELGEGEVDTTRNVCNALASLSRTSVLDDDSAECPYGGSKLETGLDSDGDRTLDDSEVSASEIVCGGNGLAMRSTRVPVGDEECPAGGMLVETGIDSDADRTLDDSEVQGRETLCDAVNALFDTETLAQDEAVCPHGGVRVKMGRDDGVPTGVAANALLELGEVEATRDVCLPSTDVLVNGGTSECSVSPGNASSGSVRWGSVGTLLVLGAALRRRRTARGGASRGGVRS